MRDNAINSLMAFNHGNKSFWGYTMLFNDFERRSKADINDDVQCKRFKSGMADVSLRARAMSHRAMSVIPLNIVKLHNFLSRMVADSPHLGRVEPKTILLSMEQDVGMGSVP
jgi:hypothetical protein